MKIRYTAQLLLIFALLSCSRPAEQVNNAAKPERLSSLPDNPCEVLSPAQVSAITGLEVTSVNRVPGLDKVIVAQRENREPDAGTLCSYETRSDFGTILIGVPDRANRDAGRYWELRAKYFETFPGAAQPVPDVGKDAWIAGGTMLRVLVHDDEYFTVSTQMHQPRSREILVSLAKVVSGQLQVGSPRPHGRGY